MQPSGSNPALWSNRAQERSGLFYHWHGSPTHIWRETIEGFQYQEGCHVRGSADLSSLSPEGRIRSRQLQLQEGRFWLNIKRISQMVWNICQWNRLPQEVEDSPSLHTVYLSGKWMAIWQKWCIPSCIVDLEWSRNWDIQASSEQVSTQPGSSLCVLEQNIASQISPSYELLWK